MTQRRFHAICQVWVNSHRSNRSSRPPTKLRPTRPGSALRSQPVSPIRDPLCRTLRLWPSSMALLPRLSGALTVASPAACARPRLARRGARRCGNDYQLYRGAEPSRRTAHEASVRGSGSAAGQPPLPVPRRPRARHARTGGASKLHHRLSRDRRSHRNRQRDPRTTELPLSSPSLSVLAIRFSVVSSLHGWRIA